MSQEIHFALGQNDSKYNISYGKHKITSSICLIQPTGSYIIQIDKIDDIYYFSGKVKYKCASENLKSVTIYICMYVYESCLGQQSHLLAYFFLYSLHCFY